MQFGQQNVLRTVEYVLIARAVLNCDIPYDKNVRLSVRQIRAFYRWRASGARFQPRTACIIALFSTKNIIAYRITICNRFLCYNLKIIECVYVYTHVHTHRYIHMCVQMGVYAHVMTIFYKFFDFCCNISKIMTEKTKLMKESIVKINPLLSHVCGFATF